MYNYEQNSPFKKDPFDSKSLDDNIPKGIVQEVHDQIGILPHVVQAINFELKSPEKPSKPETPVKKFHDVNV